MDIELDFREVVKLRKSIKKIADDGIEKNQTHRSQVKRFWKQEGRRIIALGVRDPLYQSDGTMSEEVSPLALRDKLKRKGMYSNIPYKSGRGVRVVAGNVKGGPQSVQREEAWRAIFPALGRAPGTGNNPQRWWLQPIRNQVSKGTGERFALLMADSLQSRLERETRRKRRHNILTRRTPR